MIADDERPAVPAAAHPAELEHPLGHGGAERAGQMVALLAPVDAVAHGGAAPRVEVISPGGSQMVEWDGGEVSLTGWAELAACKDEDPELFFPTGTTLNAKMQAAVAREVCTQCIVRDECRDWATDTRQDHGVWGGLDEFERRSLLRRARFA